MKKIFVLCCCFLLVSCFEVTERVKHNTNQSGEYLLTVDFSQSWLKTKSAIWLGEVDGVKIPGEEEILQKLADFKAKALKIDGITNVVTKADFENYIFSIKLNYASLKSLNAVVNSLDGKNSSLIHFKSNVNSFERIASYPIPADFVNDPEKKADLEQANIIAIYTFDRNVLSAKNSNSKISKNNKTVFLKQSMYSVLKKTSLMNNTIQLTP